MPKISNLPGAATPTLTSIIPGVVTPPGTTTSKATLQQVVNLFKTTIVTPANGGILFSDATQVQLLAPTATANQLLMSGANTSPSWSTATFPATAGTAGTILRSNGTNFVNTTATYPTTTTVDQILYSSATNTIGGITTGAEGVLVTNSFGTPSFAVPGASVTGRILATTLNNAPAWSSAIYPLNCSLGDIIYSDSGDHFTKLTGNSTTTKKFLNQTGNGILSAAPVWSALAASDITSGTLALNVGGTNANLTASTGGIIYSTATAMAVLGGTATGQQALLSGAGAAPSWSTCQYPTSTSINQLLYSSANNVIDGIAAGASGVLITNSTNVPAWSSPLTDGQIVIGDTSGTPTAANINEGLGIVVTNGPGSIELSSKGLVYLDSQTANNVAAINFESVISGAFNSYVLRFYNVVPASDADPLHLLFSTNNGVTWITTNYVTGVNSIPYNVNGWNNANATDCILISNNQSNSTSNPPLCGEVSLFNLVGSNIPMVTGQSTAYLTTSNTLGMQVCAGTNSANTNINAIRLIYPSGNITQGTFVFYGVREP